MANAVGIDELAKPESQTGSWLIDDSTKDLYLSLIVPAPAKAEGAKAPNTQVSADPDVPGSRTPPVQTPKISLKAGEPRAIAPGVKAAPPGEGQIRLSGESAGFARFALCGIGILAVAVLIYQLLAYNPATARGSARDNRPLPASESAIRTAARPDAVLAPQIGAASSQPAEVPSGADSLTLTPAVIIAPGRPDQSTTYTLVLNNQTGFELTFDLQAQDLVIRDGQTTYLPAGRIPDSIAASALFSSKSVNVKPMRSSSFGVTLTMPAHSEVRGVLITLDSTDRLPVMGEIAMTTSLGTLVTWRGQGPQTGQSSGTSFAVSQWLPNPASVPVSSGYPGVSASTDRSASTTMPEHSPGGIQP